MSRANFENELKQLHIEIIEMGSMVESAIEYSISAFKNNDLELCKNIIDSDKDVDAIEKRIESKSRNYYNSGCKDVIITKK